MRSFGPNGEIPKVAIIGGSGFTGLPDFDVIERVSDGNRYGMPSGEILIGRCGGVLIAFLERHGRDHSIPPHRIPFKANLQALKEIGISKILATCIVGSLNPRIAPNSVVIPDQFVNLTWGRDDSFDQDGYLAHIPMGEPYCVEMRSALIGSAEADSREVHERGTVVVIQGPRFSTKAESEWFMKNGWDIVNMTQYPECSFARELGLCYGTIAAVTDYDVGVPGQDLQMRADRMDQIVPLFRENVRKTTLIVKRAALVANRSTCDCAKRECTPYFRML